jgi:hypothetical protein
MCDAGRDQFLVILLQPTIMPTALRTLPTSTKIGPVLDLGMLALRIDSMTTPRPMSYGEIHGETVVGATPWS